MKRWKAYFFNILVSKESKKTFQVPNDQIRLLKRFERSTWEKYLLSLYHKKGNF